MIGAEDVGKNSGDFKIYGPSETSSLIFNLFN